MSEKDTETKQPLQLGTEDYAKRDNLYAESFWKGALDNSTHIRKKKFYEEDFDNFSHSEAHESDLSQVKELQDKLPDLDTCPKPIQDLMEDIKDMSTYDKIQTIHDFVNSNMVYPANMKDIAQDRTITSNADCIKNWQYGDCDNRAQLSACLMRYAGTDPGDMHFFLGQFSYTDDKEPPGGHAVLIVKDGDQHYLMDMNFQNAVPVKPDPDNYKGFIAEGVMRKGEHARMSHDFMDKIEKDRGDHSLNRTQITRILEYNIL